MSDNKKYYYLKLKENHFESDEMVVLESMPDGYKYSNILLKLYLRSLKNGGKLMLNDRIPFNSTMLSTITRHSVGDIEKAVKIFEELGLIEVLDNGAIYISDIQNFIGESSSEADRKRAYRGQIEHEKKKIKNKKTRGTNVRQISSKCPDKNPPEIELEKNKEQEKDIDPSLLLSPEKERKNLKTLKELKKHLIEKYDNTDYIFQIGEYQSLVIRNGFLHNTASQKDLSPQDAVQVWGQIFNYYQKQGVVA